MADIFLITLSMVFRIFSKIFGFFLKKVINELHRFPFMSACYPSGNDEFLNDDVPEIIVLKEYEQDEGKKDSETFPQQQFHVRRGKRVATSSNH